MNPLNAVNLDEVFQKGMESGECPNIKKTDYGGSRNATSAVMIMDKWLTVNTNRDSIFNQFPEPYRSIANELQKVKCLIRLFQMHKEVLEGSRRNT